MKYAVIIPTLNPPPPLIALVDELIRLGVEDIIVVNDGSTPAHAPIFESLGAYAQITVLTHSVNRGKGAALKTAFAYCAAHFTDLYGVVTADDDGQHTVADIVRVAETLASNPDRLVLGVRHFRRDNTPKRSYMGNMTINQIIRILYGLRLTDSQTGLRGVPAAALPWMSVLRGEHYEFEINMLVHAARRSILFMEIPIQHLYFDNNKASHYKTYRDTLRVARLLFINLFDRTRPYGLLFYFSRSMLRLFGRRLSVSNHKPGESGFPAVYVARHRNLKGVLDIVLWYDRPVRVWVLDVFYDRKCCFNQYAHFTLTQRFGWPRLAAYPAAFIFSLFVPALMHSMKAIPVYRNSLRQMGTTLERSVEALCANESLIIFPDMDYTNESAVMQDMYTGFINLDKLYHTKTKKHLNFIPLYVNKEDRLIETGAPARIRDGEVFTEGKKRVGAELRAYMNR